MPLEFHEPRDQLPEEVINQHRAVASLIEEMEAVMWYQQRAAVTSDPELRSALEHNRDEEMEHAMMLLEWLRRNFPGFDEQLRTYVLKDDIPLLQLEEMAEEEEGGDVGESGGSTASTGSLNIGSLKSPKGE
jgi:hypothetical protein